MKIHFRIFFDFFLIKKMSICALLLLSCYIFSQEIKDTADVHKIQQVTLESKKKLIERKIDRLIFNVENSISSIGGDAMDVLRITPSIKVLNNQISMIGKSGLSVMIDNKLVQLSGDDLINFLKTLKSDDIKSIEVITNPPAKYDAQGNSGIININLKKPRNDSWSNTIRTTYKQASHPSFSLGNNLTYKKSNLSMLLNISAARNINIYNNDIEYFYPKQYWKTEEYIKTKGNVFNGILNLGYQLSQNTNIDFQYIGSINNLNNNGMGRSYIYNINKLNIERVLNSPGFVKSLGNNHSLNLNLLKKLDTLGKQFTVDVDFFNYSVDKNNNLNAENNDYSTHTFTKEYIENINLQKINNFSAKIDFDMPYKWANLSFGGKISTTESNNNINISKYNTNNTNSILTSKQADDFTYRENVQAIYFSANRKFGEKWETKVGLRAETTQNKTYSQMADQKNKNNYIKLFPTLYISYKLNKENIFSASYGRRINRPSYSELNPARWYLTGTSYEEGNPFLQSSFTSNFELSHSYKDLLTTNLSFSNTQNEFGQLTIHDLQNDTQSYIRRNYFNYIGFTWSEHVYHSIFPWWDTTAEASIYYTETKAYSEYLDPKYSGWGGSFSNTNNFTLNKSKTFLAELSYEYYYPTKTQESKIDAYSTLGIGMKLLLLNKQLQIALNFNNILGSDRAKISNTTQGIYQTFKQYYDTQNIRLSLSYKLGGKTKVEQHEGGNQEEKNRVK